MPPRLSRPSFPGPGLGLGLLLTTALGACGSGGATPGGVKNLDLARALIAEGQVPPADALLVEAMFAEHDLALDGAPCTTTLCLRGAAGFAPEIDGTPRAWAQVGLSSAIDLDGWQRPSTTFIFTADVSGSMGWGDGDSTHPSAGRLSRALMHALADRLRPDDRVAIVTYGSDVDTRLGLTGGDQAARVHDVIDRLDEDGSTDMEGGMRRAYELGRGAVGTTEQVRVIVFTDVQPNVGATGAGAFGDLVRGAADAGVETTVLAVGLGIGPEVMRGMASLRGANAYSLTRLAEVDDFIASDYPWFTTPIAYGLEVGVTIADGWSIDRGLGFPAASDDVVELRAETVFLSRRRGALLVAIGGPAGGAGSPEGLAGSFHLRYRDADTDAPIEQDVSFGHDGEALDERGQWFAQRGVARTTALALFTEGMHEAALRYEADATAAEAVMSAAQARFAADAAALGDDDLFVEVELGAALLELIRQRAPQGTLYGPR